MDSYMTIKGKIVRVQVGVDEQALTADYIQNLRGKYKGKRLLTALAAEKKRERER